MDLTIVLDLRKYPAFMDLVDPKQTILSLIDTQHSIFQNQRNLIPTSQLNEMLKGVEKATTSSTDELKITTTNILQTFREMQTTQDKVKHSASEIKSTNEIVRANVSSLKSVSDVLQGAVTEFSDMKETLKQLPVILAKSQSKGTVGETCVSDFLKESLHSTDYVIETTSGTARSGDMRITKRDFECVIDTKFYKQAVPKKEVDKLKRDMFESKSRCGVMLSLTSGVSGYKPIDLDVYVNENDKTCCVLILTNVKEYPERILVGIKTLELIWEFFLKKSVTSTLSCSIREKSLSILSTIMESAEDLRELVRQYERHKKTITDSLTTFHDMLVKNVEKHIVRVQEKMNALSDS
jgi:hypothetical protein